MEQKMLNNERRRMSAGTEVNSVEDGVMGMKEYVASRKDGLDQWESREGELLEKLRYTVTKQTQLSKKLQTKTRGKSELMSETPFD